MTVLTFIAIVPIIVILTLLICASITSSRETARTAVLLTIFWVIVGVAFDAGCKWQRAYTLGNYTLTPITGKEPTE